MHLAFFLNSVEVLFAMVILPMLIVIPLWRILTRVGFSGMWALLALFPVVNLILLWFLAFADWPILEAHKTRRRHKHTTPAQTS